MVSPSWLTDYAADTAQADRPHVAALGTDGVVKVMPKQLSQHHLHRG